LKSDFDPATRDKAAGQYRLLILDGHNSHCTFKFCKYGADNKIIIICLPSHTTHALQPCDVGAFGPLAQSWKRVVTLASQSLTAIRKENLLSHYHTARVEALKSTTIQSAFRKTGIWPLNRDAIPLSAFEPSKNTTTHAAQPLPAHLPSILVPTPTQTPSPTPAPSPTPSATTVTALRHDADIPEEASVPDEEEEPMERYHIEVPLPLPGTASRQALRAENVMLRDIITQAGIALEEDYAQMKLMDLENQRLRKRAFEKENRKKQNKLTSGKARHMTAAENLDLLAHQDWESRMKEVLKEAAPRFKILKKNILDYHKALEKTKKTAERDARKAAAAAARSHGRARGTRAGRRGGGRGGRGRGTAAVGGAGAVADDSDLEPFDKTESSESSSESDFESEAEIPVPRSRRQRPVRVIQGRREVAAVEVVEQAAAAENEMDGRTEQPQSRQQPRPQPRPRIRHNPLETREGGGVAASSDVNASGEPEALQGRSERHAACATFGTELVPVVTEGSLGAQKGGIEVPPTMQSSEIEIEAGPQRRRNPRRGKYSEATSS
jgi:hypothetical protein